MDEEIPLPFDLPKIARKRVSAAFDGGRISSDGGVLLLAQAEHRLRIANRLARVIPDGREASRVVHQVADILRARIFAIACGYADGGDLGRLRGDPAFLAPQNCTEAATGEGRLRVDSGGSIAVPRTTAVGAFETLAPPRENAC